MGSASGDRAVMVVVVGSNGHQGKGHCKVSWGQGRAMEFIAWKKYMEEAIAEVEKWKIQHQEANQDEHTWHEHNYPPRTKSKT